MLNILIKLRMWRLAGRVANVRKKHIATKLRTKINK